MSTGFLFAQVGLGAVAGGAVIFLFSLFLVPVVLIAGLSGLGTEKDRIRSLTDAEQQGAVVRSLSSAGLLVALLLLWFAGVSFAVSVANGGFALLVPAILLGMVFAAYWMGQATAQLSLGASPASGATGRLVGGWLLGAVAVTLISVAVSWVDGGTERGTNEALAEALVRTGLPSESFEIGDYRDGRRSGTCRDFGSIRAERADVPMSDAEFLAESFEADSWVVERQLSNFNSGPTFEVTALSPDGFTRVRGLFDVEGLVVLADHGDGGCRLGIGLSHPDAIDRTVDEFPDEFPPES